MSEELFTPLYDKLVVRPDDKEKTVAGWAVPESAKEKPESGTVLSIGHGRLLADGQVIPLRVQIGDHILFGKWSGTEIELGGKKLLLMDETEVFGVLPKKAKESASE